ncbi:hypothetical protein CEE37_01710 [candidate division LCP-89 bacterium B3_LCP]|uniref:M23ase beta-sheet core domain-containing protein n=1 Tax=candidate division LCP-89 bacterium B3_LCP TaxID=2012998 RepID=A0A532V5D7_UNCL8|nr:MAG: hypothetical protein CEE37_01710 [candidate division LCP-89 bacterium B3_LCP]
MILESIFTRNVSGRFFFLIIYAWLALFLSFPAVFSADNDHAKADPGYIWPTNAGRTLSSTFAETRDTHYHFGIDVRTNHSEGYSCYAVADGDVVRIRVSPYGYGKVLYLKMADGKTAVYAHLQRFGPKVAELVTAKQYKKKSFRCQIFFEPGELHFQQGDVLAYTGSTGVGYPHLHFEIRNEEGYLNPMNFGFTVKDTRSPKPDEVTIFPLRVNAGIDGSFYPVSFPIEPAYEKGNNHYKMTAIPAVYGDIGLGISADDRADEAPNSVCFYGLELSLDDSVIFSANYDKIGFYETKQIHLERDYWLKRNENKTSHHLWKDRNMTADFFGQGGGIINTNDYKIGVHDFEIGIYDFNGNYAYIHGQIQILEDATYPQKRNISKSIAPQELPTISNTDTSGITLTPGTIKADLYNDYLIFRIPDRNSDTYSHLAVTSTLFKNIPLVAKGGELMGRLPLALFDDFNLTVDLRQVDSGGSVIRDTLNFCFQSLSPEGGTVVSDDGLFQAQFAPSALYKTVYIQVLSEDPPDEDHFTSKIYHLHAGDVPLRGDAEISIKIPANEANPEKLGIHTLSEKGEWKFIDNDRITSPGSIFGASPQMESYVLIRDLDPPELHWLSFKQKTRSHLPTLRLRVRDQLSLVDDRTVSLTVDGNWVLMEYDPEAHTITGKPRNPLSPGDHNIQVSVKDYCGNEATLSATITVSPK